MTFPQVEDDLIDQMLEIKPTANGSNHVLLKNKLHSENDWILWHKGTLGNWRLLQCKRIYGICLVELKFCTCCTEEIVG